MTAATRGHRDAGEVEEAYAFAPAHLTGIFAPRKDARDPRGRGSVGAGLVLDLGVHATARWLPNVASKVVVRSEDRRPLPISTEVARRLFGDQRGTLTVTLRHELPIGQGFGMSASGALSTALAVGTVLGADRRRSTEVAHLSEYFGGGGLGGVAAILGGGLEVRTRPGIPPWGRIVHRPFARSVFLVVEGRPLPSPRILRRDDFLSRVDAAAGSRLSEISRTPTPETFLRAAEGFTDDLGIAPPSLLRLIHRVRALGVPAAQTMFGRAAFLVPRTKVDRGRLVRLLRARGLHAIELRTSSTGARRVRTATVTV